MEIIKSIEVVVKEMTTKDGKKKFNTYKAVQKNGTLTDLKFRKEVKDLPTENCVIDVEVSKMNMQRNTKWPVLWVQEIKAIRPLAEAKGFSKDKEAEILDEMF